MSWIPEDELANRLRNEVEKDTGRLGHKLQGWTLKDKTFTTTCTVCGAGCSVSPRLIGKIRVRGEAVQFRCKISK